MSGENTDPRTEQGIGRSLESARKSRGLSLWQVEQETRIRSRYLRDLEREDFDVLPAVYVLGSLKTYADFLGLDGAALSRRLKASLIEPDEPDVAAQVAAIGGARGEEHEYEAAPVPAVGFDQLFLGMGVILISILAIMTLAAAVAQGDRSPVSQVDQPSTPEPPSEIALAGNVQDGENEGDSSGTAGNEEDAQGGDAPETSKGDEQEEEDDRNASQATSIFGDAEFVPMSPPSTASATSAASASASPAPSTAKPDDSSVPAAPASAKPSSRATSRPANDSPRAASAPSDASAPAPAPAQAPSPAGPQGGGGGSTPQGPASGSGPISADVDRMIDEVFRDNGLD